MAAALYVTTGDVTEAVITHEVTPGLFEVLGVAPRWGRTLQPGGGVGHTALPQVCLMPRKTTRWSAEAFRSRLLARARIPQALHGRP